MARTARPHEKAEFQTLLDEIEGGIEELRHAYEKYFAGIERTAPARMRQKLERTLRLLEGRQPRSTVLRFRLGGIRARFVTYKHYWTRVEHQLERGASRRDLLRMRRGAPKPAAPAEDAAAKETHPEADEAQADSEQTAGNGLPPPPPTPGKPARGKARRPSADPAAVGLDASNLREVFRTLVKAKRAAGESTDGLTYAALVRKLTREAPKLCSKHKCESLRFEVSTSGGKVRVRSRPG